MNSLQSADQSNSVAPESSPGLASEGPEPEAWERAFHSLEQPSSHEIEEIHQDQGVEPDHVPKMQPDDRASRSHLTEGLDESGDSPKRAHRLLTHRQAESSWQGAPERSRVTRGDRRRQRVVFSYQS